MKTKLAIAALVATTLGVGSLSAFAQDAGSTTPAANGLRPMHGMMNGPAGHGRGMAGRDLLDLTCAPRGVERLDVVFTRLSHRLDLTAEQRPLFDKLRETALTEATRFADTCEASMPARDAASKPDLLGRMKAGITIEEARLAALKAVLPAFEAFYNSLTDAQKAQLIFRDGRMMMDRDAPGRDAPGRDAPGRG